jgi:hypothetical protein
MCSPVVDITFDFRSDARGRDPDAHSPTLRRYHKILWSKDLPNGAAFVLSDATPGVYLHHRSPLGEFRLASDSAIATFTRWKSMRHIVGQLDAADNEDFRRIAYTIGGMIVFPSNRVDGMPTINGARGLNRKLADRLDLTLECIRRHYARIDSPLADVLNRYAEFFALFGDFAGYVEFFLLRDAVEADGSVRILTTFDDFRSSAVPQDITTYTDYRRRSIDFIQARNLRIAEYTESHAMPTPDGVA